MHFKWGSRVNRRSFFPPLIYMNYPLVQDLPRRQFVPYVSLPQYKLNITSCELYYQVTDLTKLNAT